MKIVVDIPKEIMDELQENYLIARYNYGEQVIDAVRQGVPFEDVNESVSK